MAGLAGWKMSVRCDDQLVSLLAGGASVSAVAQLAEVSERTIFRRLKDAAFRTRLADARKELLTRAMGSLTEGATDAARTLRNLLLDANPQARLGAAKAILEAATKLRDSLEIDERLAALEKALSHKPPVRR